MPAKLSAAASQASLLCAIFLFCSPGIAQQKAHATQSAFDSGFDVKLSVSPEATARLKSSSEDLIVLIAIYGAPKPGIRPNTPYGFGFTTGRRVQGRSQIIHFVASPSATANIPYPTANILWPPRIFIKIEPVDNSEHFLTCDTFAGKPEDFAAGPVPLRCDLTPEAKSEGIGTEAIPKSSSADSYAIYSLLLPGGALDMISPTKARDWAVADTTVNITDMNPAVPPDGLLKAPAENTTAFEQALLDFRIRGYERFHLKASGFRGSAPDLINQQQVQQIRNSGQGGIVFFSAVYFNNNNTAALVFVNTWCANLCSAGQWVYLEKQGGQWVRRSGMTVPGA